MCIPSRGGAHIGHCCVDKRSGRKLQLIKARARADHYPVRVVIAATMAHEKQRQRGPKLDYDQLWRVKTGRSEAGGTFCDKLEGWCKTHQEEWNEVQNTARIDEQCDSVVRALQDVGQIFHQRPTEQRQQLSKERVGLLQNRSEIIENSCETAIECANDLQEKKSAYTIATSFIGQLPVFKSRWVEVGLNRRSTCLAIVAQELVAAQ